MLSNVEINSTKKEVRTVISFDAGSSWKMIQAPLGDRYNHSYECKLSEGCGLHIHSRVGVLNKRGFFSPDQSLGLIIAAGNIGYHLNGFAESNANRIAF